MYQLKIISTSMKNCKVDDVPAIFHDDPSKSQIWVHDRWPHQNSCPSAWWTHFWSMDQLIWCRFHDESVFNIADQHSTAINLMRSTRFEFRTMSWWWVGWWSSMWVDEIEVKFQFDANFYFQVGMKFIKMRSMHPHRHLQLRVALTDELEMEINFTHVDEWWSWEFIHELCNLHRQVVEIPRKIMMSDENLVNIDQVSVFLMPAATIYSSTSMMRAHSACSWWVHRMYSMISPSIELKTHVHITE